MPFLAPNIPVNDRAHRIESSAPPATTTNNQIESVRTPLTINVGVPDRSASLPSIAVSPPISHLLSAPWSSVLHTLSTLLPHDGTYQQSRGRSIAVDCATFAECITKSAMYSLALNIPAIEEEGVRQLAAGKGIDRNIMLDHMTRIQRDGLLYVLEEESERVKPMTVHPRPDLLSHPPDRIPMLPVIPHPDSVALVSDA